MRFILLILLLTLSACSTERKVMRYANSTITTLTSEEFHGRGYQHNGIQKAENYLVEQFQKIKLHPVYPAFRQKVTYPINVIQDCTFEINHQTQKFGIEYLVSADAESQEFEAETFLFSNELLDHTIESEKDIFRLLALNKGNIPVLDFRQVSDSLKSTLYAFNDYLNKEKNLYHFPAVIHIKEKLTHGLANQQDNFLIIQTNKEIIDDTHIKVRIEANLEEEFTSNNIVGKVAGTQNDSAILVMAHYDHLGQVNDAIFRGANDNASGVSMLLNLSKYFKKNPPKNDVYFYAMTGEEAGLQGALTAVEHLPVAQDKIKFVLNLDIMGTGDDGIQVVNSSIFTDQFEILNQINTEQKLVKQIKKRGEACNSDHCPFYEKGIPSFFIYTLGGISHYHDPYDKAETLPLTDYYDIFRLLTQFIEQL